MAEITELLKQVMIFRDLDDAELAQVAEVCKEEKYVSGEFIFREGESGNRLYLIVNGEVRISRDVPGSGEEALAVLKPGALFGEMAVFDRSESFVERSREESNRTHDHSTLCASSRLKSSSISKSARLIVSTVVPPLEIACVERSVRSKTAISPKRAPRLSTASASSPEPGTSRLIRTSPSTMR